MLSGDCQLETFLRTAENAQLFYDVRNKTLRFYDATRKYVYLPTPHPVYLKSSQPCGFLNIGQPYPNLTHLHLDFCGRFTSPVLQDFAKSLPRLTSLTLLGPFLVFSEPGSNSCAPNPTSFRSKSHRVLSAADVLAGSTAIQVQMVKVPPSVKVVRDTRLARLVYARTRRLPPLPLTCQVRTTVNDNDSVFGKLSTGINALSRVLLC